MKIARLRKKHWTPELIAKRDAYLACETRKRITAAHEALHYIYAYSPKRYVKGHFIEIKFGGGRVVRDWTGGATYFAPPVTMEQAKRWIKAKLAPYMAWKHCRALHGLEGCEEGAFTSDLNDIRSLAIHKPTWNVRAIVNQVKSELITELFHEQEINMKECERAYAKLFSTKKRKA